jgi:hypothetical protein
MKQEIANWSFLIGGTIAVVSIVLKLILWLMLRSSERTSFLGSFIFWFSKIDIHDVESKRTKNVLYWSNVINFFFWFGIFFLIIGFINDTDPVEEIQPIKRKLQN